MGVQASKNKSPITRRIPSSEDAWGKTTGGELVSGKKKLERYAGAKESLSLSLFGDNTLKTRPGNQ